MKIPQPPFNTEHPADAIATALVIFSCLAEDVRRIADRLDSLTRVPEGGKPELRVRRW